MTATVTINLIDQRSGLDVRVEAESFDEDALSQAIEHAKAQALGAIQGNEAWQRSEALPGSIPFEFKTGGIVPPKSCFK